MARPGAADRAAVAVAVAVGSTGGGSGRGGTMGGGSSGAGGTGVNTLPFSFFIGADVTDQEPQPIATRGNLVTTMKSHGFNYIRLRTFVDPKASDGYDKNNGYDDIAHTVDFGKQIKDAGMGLLVDFHYSDNWADPGKQCVPVPWYGYTTIATLSTAAARLHEGRDPEAGRGRRAPRHGADRKRDHARHADSPLRQRRPADLGDESRRDGQHLELDQPRHAAEGGRRGGQGGRPDNPDRAAHRSRQRSRRPAATSS